MYLRISQGNVMDIPVPPGNPPPIQIKYIMRKLIVIKCGGLSTSLNMNCSTVHVDFEFVESDSVPENFGVYINYGVYI